MHTNNKTLLNFALFYSNQFNIFEVSLKCVYEM